MRRVFTERHGKYQPGHVIDQPPRWWLQWFPGFEEFTRLDEPDQNLEEPDEKPRRRKKVSDDDS